MKLLMKQRVFSWTDTYDVYDEAGNKKYFVKAELFRLGHQIHVFDVSGNEIGMIKQRLFTLLPSFYSFSAFSCIVNGSCNHCLPPIP